MYTFVIHHVATILCAGLLGSVAPGLGPDHAADRRPVDPATDPLYLSSRMSESRQAATDAPARNQHGDEGTSGGGGGPRGGCVDCTDSENEPLCAIPTDTVNGGCNSEPPVFSNLQCGGAFCGSGATDGFVRDTDWWMFSLDQRSIVHVTVTADYPVQVGIGDLNAGCPIPALTAGVFGDACSATRVSIILPPGTYIAFVAPQFTTTVACGAQYTGTLECDPCPCPGDFDGDQVVSLVDLALLLSSFGGAPSSPCMDTDLSGLVELQDLASFLPLFGTTCE